MYAYSLCLGNNISTFVQCSPYFPLILIFLIKFADSLIKGYNSEKNLLVIMFFCNLHIESFI